ncbi:MAG: hypothetical protein E7570_02195 [Ruminococcaceae bacterium]|nr:hypothetical protein [Oscillospiraceae bacterium]
MAKAYTESLVQVDMTTVAHGEILAQVALMQVALGETLVVAVLTVQALIDRLAPEVWIQAACGDQVVAGGPTLNKYTTETALGDAKG